MLFSLVSALIALSPVPVKLVESPTGFVLTRAGKPYFVRGAAGNSSFSMLQKLKECGGNSTRTWGADNLEPLLDDAQRLGLTVTVGIWLGHSEHGFRWTDRKSVDSQFEQAKRFVQRYRDHPAVLAWALGNEMEGGADANALWPEINRMALMVKAEDPNHPVMTVVAEMDQAKSRAISDLAPALDLVGINSYGGLISLPDRLKKFGFKKPYLVTEFGPLGPWEVGKTSFGSPLEATSTEKAQIYRRSYKAGVQDHPGRCLGSYAFLWGDKQEQTPTWFGMWLPRGERTEAVDVMREFWTGKSERRPCPKIQSFQLSKASVLPSDKLVAEVALTTAFKGRLRTTWRFGREDSADLSDFDSQEVKETGNTQRAELDPPKKAGKYRVYFLVRDSNGGAATANAPFEVK